MKGWIALSATLCTVALIAVAAVPASARVPGGQGLAIFGVFDCGDFDARGLRSPRRGSRQRLPVRHDGDRPARRSDALRIQVCCGRGFLREELRHEGRLDHLHVHADGGLWGCLHPDGRGRSTKVVVQVCGGRPPGRLRKERATRAEGLPVPASGDFVEVVERSRRLRSGTLVIAHQLPHRRGAPAPRGRGQQLHRLLTVRHPASPRLALASAVDRLGECAIGPVGLRASTREPALHRPRRIVRRACRVFDRGTGEQRFEDPFGVPIERLRRRCHRHRSHSGARRVPPRRSVGRRGEVLPWGSLGLPGLRSAAKRARA